jgi:hypothetical protein
MVTIIPSHHFRSNRPLRLPLRPFNPTQRQTLWLQTCYVIRVYAFDDSLPQNKVTCHDPMCFHASDFLAPWRSDLWQLYIIIMDAFHFQNGAQRLTSGRYVQTWIRSSHLRCLRHGVVSGSGGWAVWQSGVSSFSRSTVLAN